MEPNRNEQVAEDRAGSLSTSLGKVTPHWYAICRGTLYVLNSPFLLRGSSSPLKAFLSEALYLERLRSDDTGSDHVVGETQVPERT